MTTLLPSVCSAPLHRWLARLLLALALAPAAAAEPPGFIALSYHAVNANAEPDANAGQTAVSTANLRQQFQWLRQQGYHVIGVDDLLNARAGRKPLPDKAVLLSFDDGYANFQHNVLPLLQEFHYPALLAIVSSWLQSGADRPADAPPPAALLTWAQVRALAQTGLVEIASHSDDLHRGLLGNPQGNLQPAATTRLYNPKTQTYETDAAYQQRIRRDLHRAVGRLAAVTGKRPRVMVWPYGEANQFALQAARAEGMSITFGLRDGRNNLADLSYGRRLLITGNPVIEEFAQLMTGLRVADRPLHVVHIDMDYLYDQDPAQTERNLGMLLDRIERMQVNTIYLQAFADPDGDGNADALYFPNRHLPMRADLFNRVAWQLRIRTRAKVYAWMPVLALQIHAPDAWFVQEWHNGKPRKASHIYRRLSPFQPQARRIVGEIYQDLGKYCHFSGLLFHDDAILSDYEDVSPQALQVIRTQWQLPSTEAQLRVPAAMRWRWGQHKTQALVEWTDYLSAQVRAYRPDIKTARNYYALPILQPESEEWFAQSLTSGLQHYDYVAVEAMPFMEQAENPDAWLTELVQKVAAQPNGLAKTVFELQTVDWAKQRPIAMDVILQQLRLIQRLGAVHIGYYPDNVYQDHPRLQAMESAFALPYFP